MLLWQSDWIEVDVLAALVTDGEHTPMIFAGSMEGGGQRGVVGGWVGAAALRRRRSISGSAGVLVSESSRPD